MIPQGTHVGETDLFGYGINYGRLIVPVVIPSVDGTTGCVHGLTIGVEPVVDLVDEGTEGGEHVQFHLGAVVVCGLAVLSHVLIIAGSVHPVKGGGG